MTNYKKGVRFERELLNLLKANGYLGLRTAGSHSPFDVVVWKETPENKKIAFIAFIQCKVKKI